MSGFVPNGNDNQRLGSQYINFDQFLVQHNLGSSPQPYFGSPIQNGYYSTTQNASIPSNSYHAGFTQQTSSSFQGQTPSSFDYLPLQNVPIPINPPTNSNLTATAKEFVPKSISTNFTTEAANNKPSNDSPQSEDSETKVNNNSNRGKSRQDKNQNSPKKSAFGNDRGRNGRNQNENRRNGRDENHHENGHDNRRNGRDNLEIRESDRNDNQSVASSKNQRSNRNNRRRNKPKIGERDSNESPKPESERSEKKPESNQSSQNRQQKHKKDFRMAFADVSQREKLIQEIDSGRLECLICCEMIKPFHSVWSCDNCYHIMHLKCVMQWAKTSKSDEGWRCCACQNISTNEPRDYICFCGKEKNPQYNRSDVAHSCGNVCAKSDNCIHSCTLLCHPGPCPPCHALVTRKCGCGRLEKSLQCCQKDDVRCDQSCDKMLNCSTHRCEKNCHFGECGDCDKEVEHTCFCARENRTLLCSLENNRDTKYSCEKVCDKPLSCGQHKCVKLCHEGDCGECVLLPKTVKTCPCGKMALTDERKSCTDPVPVCTSNCRKLLRCGHVCQSKCHIGDCPPCKKQRNVKCRCGQTDQTVKCYDLQQNSDVRCKKRCTKKRSCGRHKCNQECCIDVDHICPQPCSFTLSCGKHKCDLTCHKGRCLPCYRSSFTELFCECGGEVIYPPVPCGTKRPECKRPCSRAHSCDHPVTHNCHSASACPPCMAFTTKYCHGKHEQRKIIPCSQADFSCGMPCNKMLKCGLHKCIKTCHSGICETDTDVCKQNCTKPRAMCPHNCNAPCHLNTPCPDTSCRENVEVFCQCGLRKLTRTCHDFSSEYRKIATSKLASSVAQMQSGGMIELSDVLGPIKTTNNKTLECTDDCRLKERVKRMAIALQIRNQDVSSKLQPKYSEYIRGWAKKDAKLVEMIHDRLSELVKLARESRQKSRSYSFPVMNRDKRQLVHEMCEMFGVESVAYDSEPNRNVVATATREKSWLPAMSIMEVMQRESGQRRIPVPSMNAWNVK